MIRLMMALLLATVPAAARAETGVTDHEITIGALGVLTGPLYNFGKILFDGVETVYNEVNAAGGINGRMIRYVREDDGCKPDMAISAVKKLIYDDQVFLIHGGACSNASLAAMPEIIRARIPWVITDSTAPQLTDPVNPYIFTTMIAGWMETTGQFQRALELGAKKIAIVRQHDAWAQSRYQPLLDAMAAKETRPVADVEIAPDAPDATAAALKLQASGADTVIALLFPQAGTVMLRDMYKIGYKPLIIGGSPLGEVEDFEKAIGIPAAVARLQGLAPTKPTDDPTVQHWAVLLHKYYPNEELTPWHLLGIASAQFVVEALKKAGPDLTREKLIEVMSTLSVAPDTYPGPIACHPDNHQCYRSIAWYGLVDGKLAEVGETHIP